MMKKQDPESEISARFQPFLADVLAHRQPLIHSIHMVGSALTEDYDSRTSDINSVVVLHEMDLEFLKFLAPLGKKYGKARIAAPLIMTPAYIDASRDVFPIELLNIKLLHRTVFGKDLFRDLELEKSHLRLQCERELKVKLIGLRQGYIAAAGDRKILAKNFAVAIAGYMPLFKAVIVLLGQEAPRNNAGILAALEDASGVESDVFKRVLRLKKDRLKPSIEALQVIFEDYYAAIEKLGEIIDALDR